MPADEGDDRDELLLDAGDHAAEKMEPTETAAPARGPRRHG